MAMVDARDVVKVSMLEEGVAVAWAVSDLGRRVGDREGETYMVYMSMLRERNVRRLERVKIIRGPLRKFLIRLRISVPLPVFEDLLRPSCSSSSHQMIDGA